MRPLRLTATAFGPFIDTAEVDFTTIADQRLFGIYGPTGSGKTSILDAVTFALFGEASGVERQAGHLRCRQSPAQTPTSVELVFEVAARRYLIRRLPDQQVAKQRGTGVTERKHEAYLFDCTAIPTDEVSFPDHCGKPLAEKRVTDVAEQIEHLLGYTAEQFRQVVMLPQGRFRVFLSASSDDRSHILRRLFDISVFERLTAGLKERRRSIEGERRDIATKVNERFNQVGAATFEEMTDLIEDAHAALDSLEQETNTARTHAEQRQRALRDGETLARSYKQAVDDHREAQALVLQRLAAAQAAAQRVEESRSKLEKSAGHAEERALLADRASELLRWQTLLAEADSLRRDHLSAAEQARCAEQALQSATQRIEELRGKISDAEVAERKIHQVRTLRAELTVTRAQVIAEHERLTKLLELQRRHAETTTELAQANTDLDAARDRHRHAQATLDAATEAYLGDTARMLAASLEPGLPCPVCGALDHPHPVGSESTTTDEANTSRETIEALRRNEQEVRDLVEKAQLRAAQLSAASEELSRATAGVADAPPTPAHLTVQVDELGEEIKAHDHRLSELADEEKQATTRADRAPALRSDLEIVETDRRRIQSDLDAARRLETQTAATLAERLRPIEGPLRDPDRLAQAHAEATQRSQQAATEHQRLIDQHASDALAAERTRTEHRAAVDAEKRAARRVEAAGGTELPDLNALQAAAETASTAHQQLIEQATQARSRLESLSSAHVAVSQLIEADETLGTELATVSFLAEAVDGRGQNTFKTPLVDYALAVYFEQVLASANARFARMSRGRYELRRKQDPSGGRGRSGLEISVYDGHSDTERDAATLSGGEGFLASLALALGLSDVVQAESGGIRLDAIFIDEGFGHLDSVALDEALQTLLELADGRTTGGHSPRSVGIISHVEEVKRAVPVGFEIIRSANGSAVRTRSQ